MMQILKDFAFHVYPTRKNADLIIEIDASHRYVVTQTKILPQEPDFNSLRLKKLCY